MFGLPRTFVLNADVPMRSVTLDPHLVAEGYEVPNLGGVGYRWKPWLVGVAGCEIAIVGPNMIAGFAPQSGCRKGTKRLDARREACCLGTLEPVDDEPAAGSERLNVQRLTG